MKQNNQELNLFIIWNKARYKETEILNDMKNKFTIINVYEVEWSEEYFSQNMTRFYGQKLPKGSHKEKHCGRGKFLLVIFLDKSPVYFERSTSRGKEIVNINTFDTKALYRQWTGGGHKIHGTNSIIETNHDLSLLMGIDSVEYLFKEEKVWNNKIKKIKKDLQGYNGWKDIKELFNVLNNTTDYVVLRNFESLPEYYNIGNHGDIDLLVTNYDDIKYITNSKEIFSNKKYRVCNTVNIAGENVVFDFRYISDNYYDTAWGKKILETREKNHKGFYIPNNENYFYSLLYHAIVHKYKVSPDYIKKLINLGENIEDINISERTFINIMNLKKILNSFMKRNNFLYTEPVDLSVIFNNQIANLPKLTINRKVVNKKSEYKRLIKRYILRRE